MAGAHLDSVQAGPGINDNGSGSSALLEIAQQISKLKPENTLRFAWWGAEEGGLLGSRAYVADQVASGDIEDVALYLNFDMVASPNYIFMVYDGDESGFPAPVVVPDGSIAIEKLFESYYTWAGEPYDDAEFSGRSDYQAFIQNGIPAGGLFTGAEVPKTAEQAAIWGGTAGAQYDPCYHLACDTIDNLVAQGAGRQLGRHRGGRADLRVLDGDGERRHGQEGARQLHLPGSGRSRGHRRQRRRPRARRGHGYEPTSER